MKSGVGVLDEATRFIAQRLRCAPIGGSSGQGADHGKQTEQRAGGIEIADLGGIKIRNLERVIVMKRLVDLRVPSALARGGLHRTCRGGGLGALGADPKKDGIDLLGDAGVFDMHRMRGRIVAECRIITGGEQGEAAGVAVAVAEGHAKLGLVHIEPWPVEDHHAAAELVDCRVGADQPGGLPYRGLDGIRITPVLGGNFLGDFAQTLLLAVGDALHGLIQGQRAAVRTTRHKQGRNPKAILPFLTAEMVEQVRKEGLGQADHVVAGGEHPGEDSATTTRQGDDEGVLHGVERALLASNDDHWLFQGSPNGIIHAGCGRGDWRGLRDRNP